MASYVFVWSKNKADIRDGNEYKIRKWLVLKFHGSGHLEIILHLNQNVWKWPLSKLCLLLMFFLVLKPKCTAKWHVFYVRNRHISVSSFVYKYDQWLHDRKSRCLRGRRHSSILYTLLDFFPATFLALQKVWFSR